MLFKVFTEQEPYSDANAQTGGPMPSQLPKQYESLERLFGFKNFEDVVRAIALRWRTRLLVGKKY
jgi:hypothetical protein